LPWGLSFPEGSDAYSDPSVHKFLAHTVALHPTQVYGMIGAALSAAFLYSYWPYRKYDGQIFGWMFVMAGTTRFFEEFFRADNQIGLPSISQALTQSQWIGVGLVAFGLAWLVYRRGKNTLSSAPQPVAS
jgi:prolipoprotein diacylglyceryltransferase